MHLQVGFRKGLDRNLWIPAPPVWYRPSANVSIAGNVLTRTGGTAGFNTGACSNALICAQGYADVQILVASKDQMAGLGHADPDYGYASLDYGCWFGADGKVYVYEGGSSLGQKSTWANTDTFRFRVVGTTADYLKNGTPFYTSLISVASKPLFVDTSLFTVGASVKLIQVVNT